MTGTPSSSQSHKKSARDIGPVPIAICTVSDTRTRETDVNRVYLEEAIGRAGHQVAAYSLVKDEPDLVSGVLAAFAAGPATAIIFNGGTGISRRDRTYDAISAKLDKTLPGFGEIFRMLSYEEVGAAAMLSRAVAGVLADKLVFSTPGSPAAVKLAWEKLIEPELTHLVWELRRP